MKAIRENRRIRDGNEGVQEVKLERAGKNGKDPK